MWRGHQHRFAKNQRTWKILSGGCNPERRWFGGVIRVLLPFQPFVVNPFGICPLETVGGLSEFVNHNFSGGCQVWQLRVGNKVLGNELFLCKADRLGVLGFLSRVTIPVSKDSMPLERSNPLKPEMPNKMLNTVFLHNLSRHRERNAQ